MYIQNVCLSNKELYDESGNLYALNGLTIKDNEVVKRIDNTLGGYDLDGNVIMKAKFINKLKFKKDLTLDGYSGMEREKFDSLKDVALEKIKETVTKIRNNEFDVAPIKFKGQRDLPCKYCEYKDICYMDYKDIRHVDLSGGENDEA